MSLLGIDVGSSTTKAVAFCIDGTQLAEAHETIPAIHTRPGWWEVDANDVIAATERVVRRVAASEASRRDPPTALAISASGREIVPVSAAGVALGPCLRTADVRAAARGAGLGGELSPGQWIDACGHVPDHRDPLNRLLWWREDQPDVYARAARFLGWHELITLRWCGRAVTDPGSAGKWFAFDLAAGRWSQELLDAWQVELGLLPEIEPWGSIVGVVDAAVAAELALPRGTVVGVGGFDTSCAALGSGASAPGTVGLVVGSWESFVAPIGARPAAAAIIDGTLAVGPHPGGSGLAVFALSPNGTIAVDRIRTLSGLSIAELESGLASSESGPSPVLAIPHLSGATNPWSAGEHSRGAILGISLATSKIDVARAFMEGIALDFALTLDHLRAAGMPTTLIRAAGGGSRSAWWMQLKSDLSGLPLEVVDHAEAGALGAAILAGLADGSFATLSQAVESLPRPAHRHEPSSQRAALFAARRETYRASVDALVSLYEETAEGG